MKTKIQKYLDDARSNSSQKFANADGEFSTSNRKNSNPFASMNGGYSNADGPQAPTPAPKSLPYVINVTSTSGAAVQNFAILGSNTYLYQNSGRTWDSNGNLVIGSITISSGTPGVTYQEMLAQFANQPFKVGLTYYRSATTNQIDQVVQIVSKDATGVQSLFPIVPTVDPYQQQSNVIVMDNPFEVDGFTTMVIASVLPNATITFQLYQSNKINLARGLENQSVGAEFSNPGIVKAQEVTVKG